MNFVMCVLHIVRTSKTEVLANLFLTSLLTGLSVYLVGCSDQIQLPSAEQLAEFESAGPPRRVVDVDRLVRAKIGGGPYRVVPGDALELTMPTLLQIVSLGELKVSERTAPYICRVGEAGTITLPIVGQINVEGKSIAEIESVVIDAYHPEYSATRPSVFARVLEYASAKVSITGAVQKPGVYSLRGDQMSLVALLMEAEGIVDEGAAFIRIIRADQVVPNNEAASIKTIEQAVKQLPELNEARLSEPSVRYSDLDKIDFQLAFRQSAASGTTGGLTVTYGERILLAEQLDITSEIERRALLERLVQREPRVSIAIVNQKLSDLAELLKPGYGLGNSEHRTASTNRSLNAKFNTSDPKQASTANTALYERLAVARANLLADFDLEKDSITTEQVMSARPQGPKTLVLPVIGLNTPFVDVALQDGDAVVVERLHLPLVTVVGLVDKPGNFPYPPDTQYNLMQVLGFAGGLNQVADPRYVTVYRMKQDHTIGEATFKLVDGSKMTDALNTRIKPGDIVAVEHTPRTRANVFLKNAFNMNLGAYIPLGDVWNNR